MLTIQKYRVTKKVTNLNLKAFTFFFYFLLYASFAEIFNLFQITKVFEGWVFFRLQV
jgi:hypothetical protein